MEEALQLMCSKIRLDRDKGESQLTQLLQACAGEGAATGLQDDLLKLLEADLSWEQNLGGLNGCKVIVEASRCDEGFGNAVTSRCLKLLLAEEPRVRFAVGDVLGLLSAWLGPKVYVEVRDVVLQTIRDNLTRDFEHLRVSEDEVGKLSTALSSSTSDATAVETSRPTTPAAEQILHDTAGWKALESSMKCLSAMVKGCGVRFDPYIDQSFLDLIYIALTHMNRFVRETAFLLCGSLVQGSAGEPSSSSPSKASTAGAVGQGSGSTAAGTNIFARDLGMEFAAHLAKGLADNWSQVRWAASVATRCFVLNVSDASLRQEYLKLLLPPMCLNRYYVAEGVRIYSQESWRRIVGDAGCDIVKQHIDSMVQFYVSASQADNHAVREAACSCIAELGSKIDADTVRPHVSSTLLPALIDCFRDDSWPVRDAACIASGNFVKCFPDECKPSLSLLYELFLTNLADNIPSVRQGSAAALANVAFAYGDEAVDFLCTTAKTRLEGVKDQADESKKYSQLESGPATFGVVKQAHDNDMALHENQPMYSCGSLAPKMGRGGQVHEGGCSGASKFRRPAEPWELGDGCVHLVAELTALKPAQAKSTALLPIVADACRVRHYTHHFAFLESVCKALPKIAKYLGKRPFKQYLEAFLPSIFYALDGSNQLATAAAAECLTHFAHFLGPTILRGRVEQLDPNLLTSLDRTLGPRVM
eukprot:scpid24062/ scgid2286/ 